MDLPFTYPPSTDMYCSIRTRIREGDPDFLITANSWFIGLYADGKCDPANPDIGLFRNGMLLNVSFQLWDHCRVA